MKYVGIGAFLLFSLLIGAQTISPQDLLDKAIAYHDPNDHWPDFKGSFTVVMTTPNSSDRRSEILINLPQEFFSVSAQRDANVSYYEVSKGDCLLRYNQELVDDTLAETTGMTCERAELYKNYYTYLYGLPMKLRDPGTDINHPVERKIFQRKEYLVLKVSYAKEVGSDVWFFYFNPENYAMEVYQFYKTDDSGAIIPDSGEYILLEELSSVNGIKMPRIRTWYYNKNNKLLGTDTIVSN